MYEAIDATANQTLIKTTNKFELIRYIDRLTKPEDDIYVIRYWGGVIRVFSYESFREGVLRV